MPFRVPVKKPNEEPFTQSDEDFDDVEVDVKPDVPTPPPWSSSTQSTKQIAACALVVVGFLAYRCYRAYYSEFQ